MTGNELQAREAAWYQEQIGTRIRGKSRGNYPTRLKVKPQINWREGDTMLQHDEMHKRVVKALTVMLTASLLLVIVVFTVPTPALASSEASPPPPPQPNVICQLCRWYYFCFTEFGSGTICNGGQRYYCNHVKGCIDGCMLLRAELDGGVGPE